MEKDSDSDSDDFDDDNLPGIQQQYVAAAQKQVQSEVRKNYEKMPWLLPYLKANGWWIRKENYMWFIKQYNKTGENDEDILVAENRVTIGTYLCGYQMCGGKQLTTYTFRRWWVAFTRLF
jgi:hypothetical protein